MAMLDHKGLADFRSHTIPLGSRVVINAKILSEFLKTSQCSEIVELATAIDKERERFLDAAKIPKSEESAIYWKMHKFVADLSTDMDFYVKDIDSGEFCTNLVLEWVGDTRDSVINQAKDYLLNPDNYIGCENRIGYFIRDYVHVGISDILDNDKNFWGTGGNWEVEFQYEIPDAIPPEPKNHKPLTNFFGRKIDLLTEEELIELGFVTDKD